MLNTTHKTESNGFKLQLKYDTIRGIHILYIDEWYRLILPKKAGWEKELEKIEKMITDNKFPRKAA